MKPTIAFLGVGLMGQPMAARLLAAGFPLTVWNRTREKAEPLLIDLAREGALSPSPGTPAFGSEAQARSGEGRGEGLRDDARPANGSNQDEALTLPSPGVPGEGIHGARPMVHRSLAARWAENPAAAVAGVNVVITMLTNDKAVESVLFDSGAVDAIAPGTIVIDMSTTSPPVAKDHGARLAARNIRYIDAPVSGGTRGATAGTLAIMAGGDAETIASVAPIFAAMGTGRRVGPIGSGQLCKLANELIVAVTIGAVAEALVLAEKGGADPVAVREALRGGFADSRILAEHGQRMLSRDFKPGGTVDNQIKDLKAIEAFAGATGVSLPLLATAHGLFESLRSHFGGDLDHSSLFLEIERMASNGNDQ